MTHTFGIPTRTVTESVNTLLGNAPERWEPDEETFARMVWSRLVEPGDGIAGAIVAAFGAGQALAALVENRLLDLLRSAAHSGDHDETVQMAARLRHVQRAIERWQPRLQLHEVLGGVQAAAQFGVQFLTPTNPDWPQGCNDLEEHQPMALWVRGNTQLCNVPSISIVGSRAATGYGERVTMELAGGAGSAGMCVISGGAYGIDAMAHRAALATAAGTVAILAGGVDRLYPSGNDALLQRIISEGALIAELPPGSSPTKWRFLQRNRLIAAFGAAVVVCEAGTRSGSLNTAGHAAQLGRPIGAVPGPITSPASAGCHRLLREYGAICITRAQDIVELVDPQPTAERAARRAAPSPVPKPQSDPNRWHPADDAVEPGAPAAPFGAPAGTFARPADEPPQHCRVLDALSNRSPRSVVRITQESGLAPQEVRAALAELHLRGQVQERAAGWVKRNPAPTP